jgi:hypothetical protein
MLKGARSEPVDEVKSKTTVNIGFLDQSRCVFTQVALHLGALSSLVV